MAARKRTATKTAPVQTKEIVKEKIVEVEKKAAEAVEAKAAPAEPAEVKAEVKTEAPAEVKVEAPAEKKPAKRTTKKAVKTTFVVQAAGKEVSMEEAVERVKNAWMAAGNKAADFKEVAVYVKPEENAIYYVVNDEVTGKVEF